MPAWVRTAVFGLDSWLCRLTGVYEFSSDPQCLFRIQCVRLDRPVALTDGTRLAAGDTVLELHLWNEHVPRMRHCGPTLAWACHTDRVMRRSLAELAAYLATQPRLQDIGALFADMRVNGSSQSGRAARLLARYGFEAVPGDRDRRGVLHRIGDAIYIVMLASVTHPLAPRSAALHLRKVRMWLSRGVLEQRYAAAGYRITAAAPQLYPSEERS
jgi:hypothetical protein